MGTSNASGGSSGGNPLIPNFVGNGNTPTNHVTPSSTRYNSPRNNFTRFVKSKGSNERNLRKSLSSLVTQNGGVKASTQRLRSSIKLASNLYENLNSLQRIKDKPDKLIEIDEIKTIIEEENQTEDVENISVKQYLESLVDKLSLKTGLIDDNIANIAMIEAVEDIISEINDINLQNFNPDHSSRLTKILITKSIYLKAYNDLGEKAVYFPGNTQNKERINSKMLEYIEYFVDQGWNDDISKDEGKIGEMMEKVYDKTFELLEENESDIFEEED